MGLNFLIFAILLIVVPITQNISPLDVWVQPFVSIGALMLPIITIFSSSVGCDIFKESTDSGSELIIISKPIKRWKYAVVKVSLYIFTMIVFSGLISLFGLFASFLPDFDKKQMPSLVLSIFFGSLFSSIFFGSIGVLFVQKFRHATSVIIASFFAAFLTMMLMLAPMFYVTPIKKMRDMYNVSLYQKTFIKNPLDFTKSNQPIEKTSIVYQPFTTAEMIDVIFENSKNKTIAELYRISESKTFFNESYYLNIATIFSSMFGLYDLSLSKNANISIYPAGVRYTFDDNEKITEDELNNNVSEFVNIFNKDSNIIYYLAANENNMLSSDYYDGNWYQYLDSERVIRKVFVSDKDLVYKPDNETFADEFIQKVNDSKQQIENDITLIYKLFFITFFPDAVTDTDCLIDISNLPSKIVAEKLFEAKLQTFYRLGKVHFFTSSGKNNLSADGSIYLFSWIANIYQNFQNHRLGAKLNLTPVKAIDDESGLLVKQPIYKIKIDEVIPTDIGFIAAGVGIFLLILSSSIIYTRSDIK